MTDQNAEVLRYPLLERLLAQRDLTLRGIYSIGDAAQIFRVSKRTMLDWIRNGKIAARDLPGRGRFLSEDLESFLQKSVRKQEKLGDLDGSIDDTRRERRLLDRHRDDG